MKTTININIAYSEILLLAKSLPMHQKIRLCKDLEKDGIKSLLKDILQAFKTDELTTETITSEAEVVRQKIYERKMRAR